MEFNRVFRDKRAQEIIDTVENNNIDNIFKEKSYNIKNYINKLVQKGTYNFNISITSQCLQIQTDKKTPSMQKIKELVDIFDYSHEYNLHPIYKNCATCTNCNGCMFDKCISIC
jgi:hypothetical protein